MDMKLQTASERCGVINDPVICERLLLNGILGILRIGPIPLINIKEILQKLQQDN